MTFVNQPCDHLIVSLWIEYALDCRNELSLHCDQRVLLIREGTNVTCTKHSLRSYEWVETRMTIPTVCIWFICAVLIFTNVRQKKTTAIYER